MKILDAHQHMGVLEGIVKGPMVEAAEEDSDAREYHTRVQAMDNSGIHQGIIGPAYLYLMPNGIADTRRVNDQLAQFRDRHRERFPYAVGAIEPRQGEAALEEVRRIRRELGMVGILWHNRLQACYVDSPWMRRCVRVASEEGLVPFIHCHRGSLLESPWRLERLAAEFPDTTFLVLDGLSGGEETELFYDIIQRRENILFDTGMWTVGTRKVNEVTHVMGAHRLVFGSTLYSSPQGYTRSQTVEAINEADLTDEEKQGIFSGNLSRLLGEEPPGS